MKPSVSSELSRKVTALYRQGRQEEALKALDGICNPLGIEPFPSYSYYLSRAGVLAWKDSTKRWTRLRRGWSEPRPTRAAYLALWATAGGLRIWNPCATRPTGRGWRG